jgi:hypothetical protein
LVEGGAQHSASLARKFAFAALGGQEGIIGSADLEVRALAVPGPQIRAYPGLAGILNRAAGYKNELYLASLVTEDVVNIAATSAAGPRSDMIIARIENPYPTGEPWPDPTDPKVGPYVRTAVLSNVPNTAVTIPATYAGQSAIPLARIDMPTSTATVAQSYITDLRFMAPVLRSSQRTMLQVGAGDTLFEDVYTIWPFALNLPTKIPAWATKASINIAITGSRMPVGSARGDIRAGLGTLKTQTNVFDLSNTSSGEDRDDVHCGGSVSIPASMRGTTANVYAEARTYASGVTTHLIAETFTTCTVEVDFIAEPASNV